MFTYNCPKKINRPRRSLRYGSLDALKSLKELQHKSLSAKKSQENRRRSWKSFGPGRSGLGRVWG